MLEQHKKNKKRGTHNVELISLLRHITMFSPVLYLKTSKENREKNLLHVF